MSFIEPVDPNMRRLNVDFKFNFENFDFNEYTFLREIMPGDPGYVAPPKIKKTLKNFKSWPVYIDEWARAYTGER